MKFFFQREALTAAFVVGSNWKPGNAFSLAAGHIDSPGVRLKQISDKSAEGSIKIGLEMYGGGLWHTWFDRELTLSGLAIVKTANGLEELKEGFKPGKEDHMNILMGQTKGARNEEDSTSLIGKHPQELLGIIAQNLNVQAKDIVDLDLCFSTYQNANIGGINDEYIYSGRLDNLTTCYTALKALTSADFASNKTSCSGIILYDHEEVGNTSATGMC
ncbi:Oidioi.mRNA.OKI2018_I69.XSR.g16272.t1.cds [Oikopleura dioica]|uniref:Aspartyl aminopeptidase n=1 Tax=Oikopleura dioica TaxID=34765 RepID=A0ABN7SJT1_OIKDI|nr:Oidioi.mRNA.OKI2018_I69.XSR.g16272.t1.cds [Oikopleura dioica]